MADDVQVKFGASISGLIAGVKKAKESIASIRDPVDELISGFKKLGEAIGAAFVVEKIGDLAREMAELGEKTVDVAAALGTTPGKFSLLASPMQLAGGGAGIGAITGPLKGFRNQYLNLEREKVEETTRAAKERTRIEKQEAEKAKEYWDKIYRHMDKMAKQSQRRLNESWKKISEPIERDISGALTDAVLGIRQQGGLREVMLGIEKSAVGGVMNNLVKGVGDSLFKPIFTSLFPQGGIMGGLGNLLFGGGQESVKISLLTSMNAFLATIAGATTTTAATTGTSAVTGGIGGVFSAIGSIPVIGSFAKGIGSFFGGIFTQGGIVPSAAGGWSLPAFAGGMPALLHSQEMVLPADLSQGMQHMIRSGGPGAQAAVHNHFYGPADGASIGRWFSANRSDLVAAIRGAWDSGALNLSGA